MQYRNIVVLLLIAIGGCQCEDEITNLCDEVPTLCETTTPVKVYVDVASTTPQTGVAGADVGSSPSVRVTLDAGSVPTCLVTFSVTEGNGMLTSAFSPTPSTSALVFSTSAGTAAVNSWRLGPVAGPNQVKVTDVTCPDPGLHNTIFRSNTFDANGIEPVPAALTKVEGDQPGIAGEIVAVAPKVLVRAQQNLPAPGVPVTFRVLSGGGSVNAAPMAVAATDANGHAIAAMWRLGPAVGSGTGAGVNELEASVAGLPPVVFQAIASAGSPMRVVAASSPAGAAGADASPDPEVIVTDANDNPVASAQVRFDVTAGGGTAAPSVLATDANGKARTTWTFGPQSGVLNGLTATVLSNGLADPAVAGNPVTFEHTPPATGAIQVTVSIYGNPLPGVSVSVAGPESRSGVSGSNGIIAFNGLVPGAYTVTIVPPSGIFFNPTSEQVTVVAGATATVLFEGFGLAPSRPLAMRRDRR